MKNKRKRLLLTVIITISVSFLLLLTLHIINLDKDASQNIYNTQSPLPVDITNGWLYKWGDSPVDVNGRFTWLQEGTGGWESCEFPGRPQNPGNQRSIWIKTKLPTGEWSNPTLRFRAPQQALEVYLEGRLIYSFGKIDFKNTSRTPGSIWHLVSLPSDFQGKELCFRLYSPVQSYTGYLIEIKVGTKSDHIINILKENGFSLILGCLFIFIGIIMILFLLTGSKTTESIFFLGLSTIFLGCWNIAEGKALQLFFNAPVASVYVANISMFLMPVTFIMFMERMFTKAGSRERLLLRRVWQGSFILALLTFSMDLTGLASNLQFDSALHVMIAISMAVSIYTVIKNTHKGNREIWIFASGLLILCITGLYDTYVMFYDKAQLLNPHRLTGWGMLAFVVSLIIIILIRYSRAFEHLMSDSLVNETNYRSLFKNMTEGFTFCRVMTDETGTQIDYIILETNQSFIDNIGLSREAIIGRRMLEVFPEMRGGSIIQDAGAEEAAASADGQIPISHMMLRSKWYRISSFTPREGYRSFIFSDITDMKTAEEIIKRQAYTDSMTGFFNRTYFEDVMARMSRILPELKPLSFIAIDIDGLKITNDTFGHNAGDNLLKEAAKIISGVFKSNGILTRVGGDEFCIILPDTDNRTVNEIREEIVHLIDANNNSGVTVPISMSIGTSTSDDNEDIYTVYRRADDDMYQYKLSQSGSEKSRVIDMLLAALSERDYVSQGHIERLAGMAELMADTLGLHDVEKRNLVLLSKVHDLGKIGVPDEILNKPGKLTQKEYEKMKQHVNIGYNIANRSKELVNIAPLILHHHEHWNGKGYPDGLKSEEIPLECRILGIIDAYDAMTNDRPYHKGIDKEAALAEIIRCSGSQFDPLISEKFIEAVERYLL